MVKDLQQTGVEEELLELRRKINKDTIKSNFRSKFIGGINEKDVQEYLDSIEAKYQQMEQGLKRNMQEMMASRNKLQRELEHHKAEALEEKLNLQEKLELAQRELSFYKEKYNAVHLINEQQDPKVLELENQIGQMAEELNYLQNQAASGRKERERLQEYSNELKQENRSLKEKLAELEQHSLTANNLQLEKTKYEKLLMDLELYKRKQISLEQALAEKSAEIEEWRNKYETVEEELMLEKARTSGSKINEFKNDLFHVYQRLETLTQEQVKLNEELQQQVKFEQFRAEQAENRMAELTRLIAEIKGKLDSEQNQFERQMREFAERQRHFRAELAASLHSLQLEDA
ncbi:hypothetical protein A8F94_20285 [Bacillus sp. FJAT-27225]|uniref:hypothetical protein n=1 Tax=Bacillus sp. FJAT-27225 TaxID=1743144 RepID=UPI00080C25F2|nr:hypothetical protein [Bacillus sp. FJAT-27225]OCA82254.1 hypothetical protein A8F94_20285 [Bacillus sp. FJAT-27225]